MSTKKQVSALKEIIASAQSQADAKTFERNKFADKTVYSPHRHGVQQFSNGVFLVTDGFVAVAFPDDHPMLPKDENYEAGETMFRFFSDQIEGNYFLVREPFHGDVKMTGFRKQLKEHSVLSQSNKRDLILFQTETAGGHQIESFFDIVNVRRAVEAVGGKPRLYIGYGKQRGTYSQKYPYLLVETNESDSFDLDSGYRAIVMPVRNDVF